MNHRVKVLVINTAKSNGDEPANETDSHVRDQLVAVNKVYDLAGIEFVLDKVVGPVLDSSLAVDPSGKGDEVARERHALQTPDRLVIFVRTQANATKGSLYSSDTGEHVVMLAGVPGAALAHELGHFFGLPHTHFDEGAFGAGFVKWFDPNANPPVIRPFAGRFTYLQDLLAKLGLTEAEAEAKFDGDRAMFTDTVADPGPPLFEPTDQKSDESCDEPHEATLEWEAPQGTRRKLVLKPDKQNVMSYFFGCPGTIHFSDQQAAFVRRAIETGIRKRLRRGWMSWQARDGGILKASPNAVARQDSVLDVFGWGTDDGMWQNSSVNDRWTGWFPHKDGLKLGGAPTAVSMSSDRIHLFAIDTKGVVHSKDWKDGRGWTAWKPRDGGVLKGGPRAVCRRAGVLDVFGRGTDERVWQNSLVNDKWTGWFRHKDGLEVGDEPTLALDGANRIHVFAIDKGGLVLHKLWEEGTGWTAWQPREGGVLNRSPAVDSAGISLQLYGWGMDDGLWENTRGLFSWTGWSAHDDGLKLHDSPTTPSLRFDQKRNARPLVGTHLFAIDTQGRVLHKTNVP